MANWNSFLLIRIEFLGFRYHGWQKQPGLKSIHGMVDKTISFILKHDNFKTLGTSRTDAKVSANDYAFELFLFEDPATEDFLSQLNSFLPGDIRAKSVERVDSTFNIIQSAKTKEYHYHFTFGDKPHPFSAPMIYYFGKSLDIELMVGAAKVFEGVHYFKRYTSKPSPNTIFEREITSSYIEQNETIEGNFIPNESYIYKVKSKGFMRYQVRLMMGALIDIGLGVWSIEDLKDSITKTEGPQIKRVAPSSGLTLHQIDFH